MEVNFQIQSKEAIKFPFSTFDSPHNCANLQILISSKKHQAHFCVGKWGKFVSFSGFHVVALIRTWTFDPYHINRIIGCVGSSTSFVSVNHEDCRDCIEKWTKRH